MLTQLIRPRGLALRFYLLAIFEAQCRLEAGQKWISGRPLSGPDSWADLVAIDGPYSTQAKKYLPDTKQGRTLANQRLIQVKSALRTLEGIGAQDELMSGSESSQALVSMPRKGNAWDYKQFMLLNELGKGRLETLEPYSVPYAQYGTTFAVPVGFFLNGWIHVLSDAEISVWLILMSLFYQYPDRHRDEGVYLYAARRGRMGLRRDSWEDGCARLRDFGLVRDAVKPEQQKKEAPTAVSEQSAAEHEAALAKLLEEDFTVFDFSQPEPPAVYDPNRYQLLVGYGKNALDKVMMETTLRVKALK
ncbi:hypothetical protein [Kitasatospora sp. CB01950]|uniref:hypothetical protein n=1 Tax=Kitasatospora sp. CB01950 TaxID=1703930 RepID=UPI001160FB26|nr:hypothetical protein [Kitasatospora sp. CB01950]